MTKGFKSFGEVFQGTQLNKGNEKTEENPPEVTNPTSLKAESRSTELMNEIRRITVPPEDAWLFRNVIQILKLDNPKDKADVQRCWRIQEMFYYSREGDISHEVKRLVQDEALRGAGEAIQKGLIELVRRGYKSEAYRSSENARTYPHVKGRNQEIKHRNEQARQFAAKARLSDEEIAEAIGIKPF